MKEENHMTSAECPVDVDVLDTLRELADEDTPDFFTDLIESYVDDASRLGGELLQAIAAQDVELVARTAHTMKSSSGNVGAGKLASHCAAIEAQARTHNNLDSVSEKAEHVTAELKAVVTYLSTLI
ncbi:MAG: Hpt domain-containing protein [Deltaproteobacteria bacterium]|jgi:HPt (histidine-containing phosphotransfer) domain-containing protein|nr:Hpt domain-containing protein [Deltaproteobacteria bacterium]MBT6489022.1 Hpt domain-containing protein [Deltaproteobacteria bacterium]